jgi:hypothetical protein
MEKLGEKSGKEGNPGKNRKADGPTYKNENL